MKKTTLLAALAALSITTSVIASPVNINKATASEIAQALHGVGDSKAKAIVDYREKNGMFQAPADITRVKGIGVSTFEENKQDILVK